MRTRVRERAVTEGHPQIQMLNPEATRGGGGPRGRGDGPGCESPSCGCYWQPSLRRAQPAALGFVGEGSGFGHGGRSVPAAHGTVAPASAPRPSARVTAAVLGEEPEASALSGGAARQASKNPRALRESNTAGRSAAPRHRDRACPGVRATSRVLSPLPRPQPPCRGWLGSRPLFSAGWPTLAPGV